MISALVFSDIPAVFIVLTASILMMITGCFRTISDAYRTINWESIVLIAAMMPMSFALEKTGVSEMVSVSLVDVLGKAGPHWLLAGLYFTTSLLTLFISNTATSVLMAPIAIQSAVAYGVSPLQMLFAVTFGASLCFMSPFSTPPNALVMPAGQYTFMDYIKVGAPLQILLGILMIFVIPVFFRSDHPDKYLRLDNKRCCAVTNCTPKVFLSNFLGAVHFDTASLFLFGRHGHNLTGASPGGDSESETSTQLLRNITRKFTRLRNLRMLNGAYGRLVVGKHESGR